MLIFGNITVFHYMHLSQCVLHFIIASFFNWVNFLRNPITPPACTKFPNHGCYHLDCSAAISVFVLLAGEEKTKPQNSWVPVVLATSVLFMFCTEPWGMINYVWFRAVGNALSVIVGKVPKLHCYQFFTISLLEGGIQSLILFPSSPVSPLH